MTHPSASDNAQSDMSRCIEDCRHCESTCLNTAMNFCLEHGGDHVEPEHFRLMIGCAEVCGTAARLMLASFPLHGKVCGACADICERCADDCARIGDMDECVTACRRCAESCREMAGASTTSDAADPSIAEVRKFGGESPDLSLTSL